MKAERKGGVTSDRAGAGPVLEAWPSRDGAPLPLPPGRRKDVQAHFREDGRELKEAHD